MSDRLALATRAGLPDDLAYLRAAYPQPGWRGHANFGQLADFWLHVHAALRREGAAVIETTCAFGERRTDAAGFARALVPQLNRFLGHLDQHHRIEDVAYFPKFRTLDPRMEAGFELLEADHAVIHTGIEDAVAAARALLAGLGGGDPRAPADAFARHAEGLVALLGRHLADEEDLVIPALLHHGERSVG